MSAMPLRVAVISTPARTDSLAARLTLAGAEVHALSLTRVARLDPAPLHAALRSLHDTRWILLTSEHAVHAFADAVEHTKTDDAVADRYVTIVGEATARAAETHGWLADMIPVQQSGEALLDVFAGRDDITGTGVLYPCAAGVRDVLPEGLRTLGAHVDAVPCYANVADGESGRRLRRLLADGALDLVAVTAPGAVDALADAVPPEQAGRLALASIGPVTSKAARQAGFRVSLEADPYTVEGLARAIARVRPA